MVPSILSGRTPDRTDLLPIAADYPDNLFTLLANSHRMVVSETMTFLLPRGLSNNVWRGFPERMRSLAQDLSFVYAHMVLPHNMTWRLPPVTGVFGFFGAQDHPDESIALFRKRRFETRRQVKTELARDRAAVFRDFIASVDEDTSPTLYFLHVILPHAPWQYLDTGRSYDGIFAPGLKDHIWTEEEWPTALAYQRHLLQAGFADRLVGELLDRLEATGVYERSLVVLTADHGVTFTPGAHRRVPTEATAQDVMNVPLFIKEPGQRESRVDLRSFETIDILPTIADHLGTELPWPHPGHSALDTTSPERPEKVMHHGAGKLVRAADFPATWPALTRRFELFGHAKTWREHYAMGPERELVGQRVDTLRQGDALPCEVLLEQAEELERVDLQSRRLPVLLTGRVRGDLSALPEDVAVIVNGVIEAVTEPFERSDRSARLAVLIPESSLVAGRNEVSFYGIAGDGHLAPLDEQN